MRSFEYKGVDKSGSRVRGQLEAKTEGDARMVLRAQGVRPNVLVRRGSLNATLRGILLSHRFSQIDLEFFSKQLQILVGSRLSLSSALSLLRQQYSAEPIGEVITDILGRMQKGATYCDALSYQGASFPRFYVSMMRLTPSSSMAPGAGAQDLLDPAFNSAMGLRLDRLSRFFIQMQTQSSLIQRAALSLFFVAVFIALLALFAIVQIPPVASFFTMIRKYIFPLALVMTGPTYLFYRYLTLAEGRKTRDWLLSLIPGVPWVMRVTRVIRFCRLMQMLLASGFDVIEAIDLSLVELDTPFAGFAWLRGGVRIRKELETGTVASLLGRTRFFSKAALQIVADGESSGKLDLAFGQLAAFYENELVRRLGPLGRPQFLGSVFGLCAVFFIAVQIFLMNARVF